MYYKGNTTGQQCVVKKIILSQSTSMFSRIILHALLLIYLLLVHLFKW